MKNTLILLALFVCISIGNAQVTKVRVDTYNGSTHTYSYNDTYTNSQTDTTEWVNFADCDSIHFYISTSDSAKVFITPIYGDESLSKATASAVTDSLIATATGWKSISWAKLVAGCGNEIIGSKFKIAFQSAGNAASSESARYAVYVKKYKRK